MYNIKHIPSHRVEFRKWDILIQNSPGGTFYAMSWFLNSVCEDWEVLIHGDYKAGMFLPMRKLLGIKIIYQPFPMMQLGIFSRTALAQMNAEDFIRAIPRNYRWHNIHLNKYSLVTPSRSIFQKQVFDLDLILTKKMLFARFSKNVLKKIEKARQANFSLMKSLAPNNIIDLWVNSHNLSNTNINKLRRVLARGIQNRMCEIWGTYSGHNNLVSCAVFFFYKNKIILSFTAMSKTDGSTGLIWLIQRFIEEHSEKNLVLRLEQPLKSKFHLLTLIKKHPLNNLSQLYTGLGAQVNEYPVIQSKNSFLPF